MGPIGWLHVYGIHAFAIRHEAQEKRRTDPDFDEFADNYWDPFIDEGLSTTSESNSAINPEYSRTRVPTQLQLAKRQREKLKEKLFRFKVKRSQQVAQQHCSALGADISSPESL